jgi:hypothetical protein
VWQNGYYYRSHRLGGRVVHEYVGAGAAARSAALADERRRRERRREAARRARERAALDELDRRLAGLEREARLLAGAALAAAGYHQHKRGEWRRQRMKTAEPKTAGPVPASRLPALPTRDELLALFRRAQSGDESAVPAVRELFRRPEAVAALPMQMSPFEEEQLVGAMAGTDLLYRENILAQAGRLRAELSGPDPSPLEKLLVDRAVMARLHVYHAESRLAQRYQAGSPASLLEFWQRAIDRAHRRLLSAVRVLAQVRRLALPVLLAQVNVAAQQQVNNGV